MRTDLEALVAAAQDGDRAAFDELVRATYIDTYTLAYRLTGDEEDARDVVQEAYLRAYRGLKRFRGDAQFSTWMYRITANCAATFLGKRTRTATTSSTTSSSVDERPTDGRPRGLARCRGDPRPAAGGAAPPAAAAAGRGGAPRRLRPAPRVDRRRARHLRVGGQGAPAPGPPQAPRRPGPDAATHRRAGDARTGGPMPVRCEQRRAGARRRGRRVRSRSTPPTRATSSTACAARPRSCSTASCCGRCGRCAPRCSSRRRACCPTSSPRIEEAGERRALRELLDGRRVAYLGGLAAATAAGVGGRHRARRRSRPRARLAELSPIGASVRRRTGCVRRASRAVA